MLRSAAGLVVASWSVPANAAPFDLAWSAPAGCPSREEIVHATEERRRESASGASPELFVQGTVVAVRDGFVVALALKDASGHALGEREVRVEQRSCKAIEDPTSVVLAMMIAVARARVEEPGKHGEVAESPPPATLPSPPSAPAPLPSPPSPPVRPIAPLSREPSPHRLLVGAAGVGSLGVLPNPGFGLAVRAMFAPRSVVVVGLEAWFESSSSVRVAGADVGFQHVGISARVGVPALQTARFELIPTVSVRAGALRNLPSGLREAENEIRPTLLVGPGALVRIKLGSRLFAEALPEVEAVVVRDRLQLVSGDKLYSVHRPSLFEARLSLGVGYELP